MIASIWVVKWLSKSQLVSIMAVFFGCLVSLPSLAQQDPSFSAVSVLMPLDGPDGSTVFNDVSSSPSSFLPVGPVIISKAQSRFGGASGYFGNGGHLYCPNCPVSIEGGSFVNPTSNFTVEMWVYLTGVSAAGTGGVAFGVGDYDAGSGWGAAWSFGVSEFDAVEFSVNASSQDPTKV